MTPAIESAIKSFDWMQPALHGGSPCFHICDDGRFCGRAERWPGHLDNDPHAHVSMLDFFNGQVSHLMKENISLRLAMDDGMIALHDKLEAERQKNADLRDILEYYANEDMYEPDWTDGKETILKDQGREAKKALGR